MIVESIDRATTASMLMTWIADYYTK